MIDYYLSEPIKLKDGMFASKWLLFLATQDVQRVPLFYLHQALHNLKSSVPIDRQTDCPHTYQRRRPIARDMSEREYIKQIYDQRMERKLRERYRGQVSRMEDERDVLQRELQQFNTSKVLPSSSNPEAAQNTEPSSPRLASIASNTPSQQQALAKKPEDNSQNERESILNDRGWRYSERERSMDYYQERQRLRQQQESCDYNKQSQERSHSELNTLNKGSSQLASHPYRPPYHILHSPHYRPYQEQQQYINDSSRLFVYPQELPAPNQKHLFRNVLPDRLQEFLRQKTKSDGKSNIMVTLKGG